jgi:hypothetical protein
VAHENFILLPPSNPGEGLNVRPQKQIGNEFLGNVLRMHRAQVVLHDLERTLQVVEERGRAVPPAAVGGVWLNDPTNKQPLSTFQRPEEPVPTAGR